IGSLSGVVDEIRRLAQRPPLPVGLGARTLGFRRGTDGVTPKQEPHRRFIETRDVQDGRRRLLRVAGLRAIVLALKPRGGSDRRGIGGIVRENGLGGSREVRAEAPGLDDRDFDPERPDSLASTSEKPSTPHLAAAYAPRPIGPTRPPTDENWRIRPAP